MTVLHCQAQLVENHKELHRDLNDVDYEAAEVHLSQCAEENSDIDEHVDTAHKLDEAVHDREGQMDEPTNHQNAPMFLAFRCGRHHGLAHVIAAAEG